MSKLFIRVTAGLCLICAPLIATEATPAYPLSQIAAVGCNPNELARAGQLTYRARQDAWVSKRGDLFRVSQCPALKDRLVAANS